MQCAVIGLCKQLKLNAVLTVVYILQCPCSVNYTIEQCSGIILLNKQQVMFTLVQCVQCTVYSVQFTVYSVQCTVYSVQCVVLCVQLHCAVAHVDSGSH